jgi:calcineurin-like phosphoesterase family protein
MKEQPIHYWIISDTHFNHIKLEEWGGRSGDWQEKLWESMTSIPEGDVLIHLGDICIGEDAKIHESIALLKCRKILIRGNHDGKSVNWYLTHGWDFVCDGLDLLYQGHYLFLSHRPTPPMFHYNYNFHGHTHGNLHRSEEYVAYHDPSYHKDFSPELVGFGAIRLDTYLKTLK